MASVPSAAAGSSPARTPGATDSNPNPNPNPHLTFNLTFNLPPTQIPTPTVGATRTATAAPRPLARRAPLSPSTSNACATCRRRRPCRPRRRRPCPARHRRPRHLPRHGQRIAAVGAGPAIACAPATTVAWASVPTAPAGSSRGRRRGATWPPRAPPSPRRAASVKPSSRAPRSLAG